MSCKEIAGISIAGNHEETKKLRITYNESLVIKIVNKTRIGELHVQDIFDQVC